MDENTVKNAVRAATLGVAASLELIAAELSGATPRVRAAIRDSADKLRQVVEFADNEEVEAATNAAAQNSEPQ